MTTTTIRTVNIEEATQALKFIFEPTDFIEFRCLGKGRAASDYTTASEFSGCKPLHDFLNAWHHPVSGIYFGPNPRKEAGGSGHQGAGLDSDVLLFRNAFVDFDDATIEQAKERIRKAGLPKPTLLIASGRWNGCHAYWRYDQPIDDAVLWRGLQRRLIGLVQSDPAIKNPSRIMRLPGSYNFKQDAPCMVKETGSSFPNWRSLNIEPEAEPEWNGEPLDPNAPPNRDGLNYTTTQFLDHPCPEGNRNRILFAVAIDYKANNIPFDEAKEELVVKRAMARDGLSEVEAMRTLRNAYKREDATPTPSGWSTDDESNATRRVCWAAYCDELNMKNILYGMAEKGLEVISMPPAEGFNPMDYLPTVLKDTGTPLAAVLAVDDAVENRFAKSDQSVAKQLASIKQNGLMSGAAAERVDQQRRRDNRADEYGTTDLENGGRFSAYLDGKAVYVALWKCWLIFDGTVWRRDETGRIKRLARKCIKKYLKSVADMEPGEKRDSAWGNARRMESKSGMAAMLSMAEFDDRVAKHPEQFDLDDFAFNTIDGTLDLRANKLNPHNPADYITKISPVGFDANSGPPPVFERFMREIFPDAEVREFVYVLLGIFLSGDVSNHIFVIFYGIGSNGKSTLLDLILYLLAEYASTAPDSLLTQRRNSEHPAEVALLDGKRFILATENDAGSKLKVGQMKKLTGDGYLVGRFMGCNFFTFRRTFKLVLATNHRPRIDEDSDGAWRRILPVPCTVSIPPERQDLDLSEKLRAEGSQILAVLSGYCFRWLKAGKVLTIPEAVRAATSEYREAEDAIGDFIAARLVQGTGKTIKIRDLMQRYESWARAEGIKFTRSPHAIYARIMREDSVEKYKDSKGDRGFKGIGANEKSDETGDMPPI